MVMVMLVPAATLTVQTYEPEAPVWSGRFSMGAAETSPPGRMLRRTVPVAPCHERAAGWHWVIEAGVLMVAAEAAAANTTAPAAAEEILTILKDERGVVRGARARCSEVGYRDMMEKERVDGCLYGGSHIYSRRKATEGGGKGRGGGASEGKRRAAERARRQYSNPSHCPGAVAQEAQAQAQIEVQGCAAAARQNQRGTDGHERGRSVGQLYIGHCSRVNAQHSLGRMVATAAREGARGGKGRSPRLQTQPRRPSRPGGHRRGEARRKCWKLQRSPSEMSRAGPRYCDRATAPSGIPIQFQSRHTQAQAPAGTREPCPKHAACPEGAQERGRVQGGPLSILTGPRPMLDLPSFLVCRFGGDRETSAANCRCPV